MDGCDLPGEQTAAEAEVTKEMYLFLTDSVKHNEFHETRAKDM